MSMKITIECHFCDTSFNAHKKEDKNYYRCKNCGRYVEWDINRKTRI